MCARVCFGPNGTQFGTHVPQIIVFQWFAMPFVAPSGIEPLSEVPETSILSVELWSRAATSQRKRPPNDTQHNAMTIRLNLKRPKGRTSAIRLVIRLKGVKHVLSTGVSVDTAKWDKKRERVKDDPAVNERLTALIEKVKREIERTGAVPEKIEKVEEKTVLDAIKERRARLVGEGKSRNTWRAYDTLTVLIGRYCSEEGKRVPYLSEINVAFLRGFVAWMIEKNYAASHCNKMSKTIRTVIRKLVPESVWSEIVPPQAIPRDAVYLSPDEVEMLECCVYEKEEDEELRDMFLVGIYTGQRFSDWAKVNFNRVTLIGGVKVLTLQQDKTGSRVSLPVGQKLNTLMEKYRAEGFPGRSNQYFNRRIKEVCRLAGIVQVVSFTIYKGAGSNTKSVPKYTLISSHTARRTFATNAVLAGIPVSEIMKFTGHKSLSSFFLYIRTSGQEAALNYANHQFFA